MSELNSCPLMKAIWRWPSCRRWLSATLAARCVIENYIHDTFHLIVPGNSHDWDRERKAPGRVNGDEAVHRPFKKKAWVFID